MSLTFSPFTKNLTILPLSLSQLNLNSTFSFYITSLKSNFWFAFVMLIKVLPCHHCILGIIPSIVSEILIRLYICHMLKTKGYVFLNNYALAILSNQGHVTLAYYFKYIFFPWDQMISFHRYIFLTLT